MNGYKFPTSLSENIVKGILEGYNSYLAERKQKKRDMNISSAYAWVKGNHIEHAVSERCIEGLEYKPSKAGYTWGYLRFGNKEDRVLFIIKNRSALGRTVAAVKKKKPEETNYLIELADINKNLKFPEQVHEENNSSQLKFSLFDSISLVDESLADIEIEEIKNEFDRFYIVTYVIDEAKMISEINLLLPVPGLSKFYQVADWTHLIEKADVTFDEEALSVIRDEKEPEQQIATGDYGIEIPSQDLTAQDE